MENIRFGIVGCGMISRAHVQALAEVDGALAVGVYDPNLERANAFGEKWRLKVYPAYEDMLLDSDIDAVCICTPSGLHKEGALAALKKGKHVVLEKPMALNTHDCEQICLEVESSGKYLTVISQNRFCEDVQRVKKLISESAFGTLVMCDLYMKYWRDPSYYAGSPWRGTWNMDGGGALMNQGIHGIDLMNFIVGKSKLLKGRTKTLVHNIEVEDTSAALVEYECGALGVIEGTTSSYPGFSCRIEIHGSNGYAKLVEGKIEELCVRGKMVVEKTAIAKSGTESDPSKLSYICHVMQLTNFVKAVRGKEELISTARDGYEAVRLINEIYLSSEKDI